MDVPFTVYTVIAALLYVWLRLILELIRDGTRGGAGASGPYYRYLVGWTAKPALRNEHGMDKFEGKFIVVVEEGGNDGK